MKKLLQNSLMAAAALLMAGSAYAANQIYLIGAPQPGGGWDIEDGSMVLPETSTPGIYQASFEIPAGKFMFRFYTELGNWDANSLGSQVNDDPITIEFTDDLYYIAHYVQGKGSWSDPYWSGGKVYITVDTNTKSVTFTTNDDVVVPELMPDLYIVGNNINGASAWDANNMMTYDYSANVYTWTGTSLGSGFKFNDGGWDGDYNIGSNGSPIEEGVAYTFYNGSGSGNIEFSSSNVVINNPKVVLDLKGGTVTVTGSAEQQEISLTLAGTMNDWVANDPDYQLTKNSDGLYEGTFYMFPGSEFQVVLLGSQWLGCENDMGEIALDGMESVTRKLAKGYQNNFMLTDWEGGNLNFLVDMDAMTLVISTGNGGVDSIENDINGREVIYNLQGVKVRKDNLKKGIYILNGKKVLVK